MAARQRGRDRGRVPGGHLNLIYDNVSQQWFQGNQNVTHLMPANIQPPGAGGGRGRATSAITAAPPARGLMGVLAGALAGIGGGMAGAAGGIAAAPVLTHHQVVEQEFTSRDAAQRAGEAAAQRLIDLQGRVPQVLQLGRTRSSDQRAHEDIQAQGSPQHVL